VTKDLPCVARYPAHLSHVTGILEFLTPPNQYEAWNRVGFRPNSALAWLKAVKRGAFRVRFQSGIPYRCLRSIEEYAIRKNYVGTYSYPESISARFYDFITRIRSIIAISNS
jgi:hypothetical protein